MNDVINDSERAAKSIAWQTQPQHAQPEGRHTTETLPKIPSSTDNSARQGPIAAKIFRRIPFDKVNWPTSSFLIGAFIISLTLTPIYIWHSGIDWFQVTLFFVMLCACGFSITLGYHRLSFPGLPAESKLSGPDDASFHHLHQATSI